LGTDRGPQLDESEGATYCARHPDVETYLRCGRCETPICPRCLVQTPVGARCRDCANITRLPTFDVTPVFFARGFAAAMAAGLVVGGIWGGLKGPLGFGFIFAALLGLAAGWAVSEAVSLATNRKRGLALQICAIGGVGLAFLVQDFVAGDTAAFAGGFARQGDLILLIVGAIFAAVRLKAG
jgi:hypothetical protein